MTTISPRLQVVRDRLVTACERSGRSPDTITLLAVSKRQPAEALRAAFEAGQRDFGENYVQEGLDKIEALADLRAQLRWHLIGPLQSNKTRVVAEHFDWVHSIDRLRIAERLAAQRPAGLAPLQVCLQVNVDGGANKAGVSPDELSELALAVSRLPRLRLRGLMAIPEPSDEVGIQRAAFRQVRELWEGLRAQGLVLDTLSMGMSDDLESAVAEGATLVRVGRAVFGHRPRKGAAIASAAGSA